MPHQEPCEQLMRIQMTTGGGKTYPLSVRVLWLLPSTAGCSEQNSQKHQIKTGKRNKYNK